MVKVATNLIQKIKKEGFETKYIPPGGVEEWYPCRSGRGEEDFWFFFDGFMIGCLVRLSIVGFLTLIKVLFLS